MSGRAERIGRRAVQVLAMLLILVIAVFAWGLHEMRRPYAEGDAAYAEIVRMAASSKTEAAPLQTMPQASVEAVDTRPRIPGRSLDFASLLAMNEDTAAWLYCPDTMIDYPVMRADDYEYYLHRLPTRVKNVNGSLFLDYHCAADFSDSLSIIYGHHMKSGKMFGGLSKYKEQAYFETHPYMYLYTLQGDYRVELKYGFVIAVNAWDSAGFYLPGNLDGLLQLAEAGTTFQSPAEFTEEDRWIALSTCSYEFNGARYVVLGVLKQALQEEQSPEALEGKP